MVGPTLATLALFAPGPPGDSTKPLAALTADAIRTGSVSVRGTAYACANEVAGKLPLQLALRHFIKKATPKPMRFLVAAGTDSALSEMGAKVLQEFGPMYYYAGSEATRQKVRERLDIVGPFPALLIVKRSGPKPTGNTETIRLGGHYVTGEHDGKKAESNEYTFVCGPSGWTLKGVKVEGAA